MPAAWLMCALLATTSGASEKPKLIVMELSAAGGVESGVASVLGEAVTAEVAARGYFAVVSAKEVETMLGVERQRQLVGCSEDASACLTELAGALGARFVVSGSVARLGDAYQLGLQTLDTQKAETVGRSTRMARSLEALRAQIPFAIAEATGTPLPPPPSKLRSYALIGGGAVALVCAGILGQDALARQRSLHDELGRGESSGGGLRTYAEYEDVRHGIQRDKTLAWVGLGVGAALVGAGIAWMPSELPVGRREVEVKLSLGPRGRGVGVVGVWK